MRRLRSRTVLSLTVALAAAVVAAVAAVAGHGSSKTLWGQPPIGDSWGDYFGVQVEQTLDGRGPKLVHPKPGQLYFYTNSGTAWGATNKKNSVEIFDATNM